MRLAVARWCRPVALAACAGFLVVPVAAPASASCARQPPDSPYAFVGTVTATTEGGRIADVVTEDGATVTVQGTQDTSWFSNTYTSVDRQYEVGATYEFHPRNADSPYSDNACTATRHLSGPTASPNPPAPTDVLPAWLPVDEQAGPLGYLLFFAPLAAAALALFTVIRHLARTRRRRAAAT